MQIVNGNRGSIGVVHKATVLAKWEDQARPAAHTGAWCKFWRSNVTEGRLLERKCIIFDTVTAVLLATPYRISSVLQLEPII